jgi:hypothetical protein
VTLPDRLAHAFRISIAQAEPVVPESRARPVADVNMSDLVEKVAPIDPLRQEIE